LETLWIKRLDSKNRKIGYNMTAGGEGIRDPDGIVRKKLSEATKRHQGGDPKRNPAYRHDVPLEEVIAVRERGDEVRDIAKHFGVSDSCIYRRLNKNNIPLTRNTKNQDAEIANLYVKERYTTTEIASLIKASPAKVYNSLVRQEISLRPPGSIPRRALRTEKKCPGCGLTKAVSEYDINRAQSDGHTSRCRDCENKANRARRKKRKQEEEQGILTRKFPNRVYVADRTEKKCGRCKSLFPLDVFTKDRNSPDGRGAYCPKCRSEIGKERYARSKKATDPSPCLENEQRLGLSSAPPDVVSS
jgi:hypothetical protein